MIMENLFEEKISREKGLTKINLQCWVEITKDLDQMQYSRTISKFTKNIKNILFELKEKNKDSYEYFVDVDIRDSPSKTAFLSLQISLIKNQSIIQIKDYVNNLKSAIENYEYFKVFENIKKRKK